jgi:hypothetical protein
MRGEAGKIVRIRLGSVDKRDRPDTSSRPDKSDGQRLSRLIRRAIGYDGGEYDCERREVDMQKNVFRCLAAAKKRALSGTAMHGHSLPTR